MKPRLYLSPYLQALIIGVSIVAVELLVLAILYIFPNLPKSLDTFIDGALFFVILTPLLRCLISKPMEKQIRQREIAEASLTEYKQNLEKIIEDRTAELTEAVKELEREIAERKRTEEALQSSEERFRQLFQQTEDAIILFKPGTCRIIDVNPVAERLYGYSKQELFELGPSCFVRPEDYGRFCQIISGARQGEVLRVDSTIHRRKDGAEIIVSARGKMVTIQRVDLVYCTLRDITKRVRLEDEARLIQAKLIHTNKMTSLGVLVAGIAHEINNPNNFILVNSEMLSKAWGDIYPVLLEYYEENGDFLVGGIHFSEMNEFFPDLFTGIRDGSRRIRDIINNLKEFARDEKTSPSAHVDLNRAIRGAVMILGHQIKKHTRHFKLDLFEHLPVVKGSSQQLEQVVINLVMNALQALPNDECSVFVSTSFDNEHESVLVRVRDEGPGIPREIANRILEPFFTTRLDSGGSGLGLAICNSIIREHRGTLEYESAPGKGTTFTVRLPANVS